MVSGLTLVHGQGPEENGKAIAGFSLASNKSYNVEITFDPEQHGRNVKVKIDGKQVLEWGERPDAISLPEELEIGAGQLGLAARNCSVRFESFTLTAPEMSENDGQQPPQQRTRPTGPPPGGRMPPPGGGRPPRR